MLQKEPPGMLPFRVCPQTSAVSRRHLGTEGNVASQPCATLRQRNLHGAQSSIRFTYTARFEKHCLSEHPLEVCHRQDLLAKP